MLLTLTIFTTSLTQYPCISGMQWDSTSQTGENIDTQGQMEFHFILQYDLHNTKNPISRITTQPPRSEDNGLIIPYTEKKYPGIQGARLPS